MKKQKRYTDQFEIQADVLKQKKRLKSLLIKAEVLERNMNESFNKAGNLGRGKDGHFFMQEGFDSKRGLGKVLKSIRNIEESALPRLQRAAAAMGTEVFEFSKGDRSVVL